MYVLSLLRKCLSLSTSKYQQSTSASFIYSILFDYTDFSSMVTSFVIKPSKQWRKSIKLSSLNIQSMHTTASLIWHLDHQWQGEIERPELNRLQIFSNSTKLSFFCLLSQCYLCALTSISQKIKNSPWQLLFQYWKLIIKSYKCYLQSKLNPPPLVSHHCITN